MCMLALLLPRCLLRCLAHLLVPLLKVVVLEIVTLNVYNIVCSSSYTICLHKVLDFLLLSAVVLERLSYLLLSKPTHSARHSATLLSVHLPDAYLLSVRCWLQCSPYTAR